jgi:hypothetical protein
MKTKQTKNGNFFLRSLGLLAVYPQDRRRACLHLQNISLTAQLKCGMVMDLSVAFCPTPCWRGFSRPIFPGRTGWSGSGGTGAEARFSCRNQTPAKPAQGFQKFFIPLVAFCAEDFIVRSV